MKFKLRQERHRREYVAPDGVVIFWRAFLQICRAYGVGLDVMSLDKNMKAAPATACAAVEKIHFDGAHFRRDIAAKALS